MTKNKIITPFEDSICFSSKKIKMKITEAQLEAIKHLTDDCHAMCDTNDKEDTRLLRSHIAKIDRMLRKNGHRRYFDEDNKKNA